MNHNARCLDGGRTARPRRSLRRCAGGSGPHDETRRLRHHRAQVRIVPAERGGARMPDFPLVLGGHSVIHQDALKSGLHAPRSGEQLPRPHVWHVQVRKQPLKTQNLDPRQRVAAAFGTTEQIGVQRSSPLMGEDPPAAPPQPNARRFSRR